MVYRKNQGTASAVPFLVLSRQSAVLSPQDLEFPVSSETPEPRV